MLSRAKKWSAYVAYLTSVGISLNDVEMFEILHMDWNLKPIFTQKWASVDKNWGWTPNNPNMGWVSRVWRQYQHSIDYLGDQQYQSTEGRQKLHERHDNTINTHKKNTETEKVVNLP